MPPLNPRQTSGNAPPSTPRTPPSIIRLGYNTAQSLLFDRRYFFHLVAILFLGEAVLGSLIIWKIPYTKIDWDAYMQHVELFLGGERDYSKLVGETGPCVYPALHLYIYTLLYKVLPRPDTDSLPTHLHAVPSSPAQIRIGQIFFLGIYLLTFLLISGIYYLASDPTPSAASPPTDGKSPVAGSATTASPTPTPNPIPSTRPTPRQYPQALLIPLTLSKRLHSLYMLRLFNDPFAMLFLYAGVLVIMRWRGHKAGWTWGCRLISLAIGVKMNILLFIPGLLVLLVQHRGVVGTIRHVLDMLLIQILLPAPFFLSSTANATAYYTSAFDFSREFLYKWTVNMRFIPERIFLSKELPTTLLVSQAILLLSFAWGKWNDPFGGTVAVVKTALASPASAPARAQDKESNAAHIPLVLFTSNLIGVYCARSLHYQFHSWYFHQIPFLLYAGGAAGNVILGTALWLAIEFAWSTFPSTITSSLALFFAHAIMITALRWYGKVDLAAHRVELGRGYWPFVGVFLAPIVAVVGWGVKMAYLYGGVEVGGKAVKG